MRLEIALPGKERLVGRNQRHAATIGIVDEPGFGEGFLRPPVALQLDIEAVAEQLAQPVEPSRGVRFETVGEPGVDRPLGTTRQTNDAGKVVAVEPVEPSRGAAVLALQIGAADQPRQVAEAGLVSGHQHHAALA